MSQLHEAAKRGEMEELRLLLDDIPKKPWWRSQSRWGVNARDDFGDTLLHKAAQFGHIELASLLLERGADVNPRNERDKTPLHYAVSWGHAEMADLLRRHGGVE